MDRSGDKMDQVDSAENRAGDDPRRSVSSSVDLEPYLKPAPVCSLDTDEDDSADEQASAESGSPMKRPYLQSLSSEEIELQMDKKAYADQCRNLLRSGFIWRQQAIHPTGVETPSEECNKNLVDEDQRESDEASTVPVRSDVDSSIESERADPAANFMNMPKAWKPRFTPEPPTYEQATNMDQMDIEEQSTEDKDMDCEMFGPLSGVCSAIGRFFRKRVNSPLRMAIVILAIIGIIGLALMVVLIPTSFVSLEYNLIALEKNVVTGTVDRSKVFYPGCYLLTPSSEFVEYPGTVHNIVDTITVMTTDELAIDITFHLHYFIKPEELGKLHEKFDMDYKEPIQNIIVSTIKNHATQYQLDDFRAKRIELQKTFYSALSTRLEGNCCPACCPGHCKNNRVCNTCKSTDNCNQAYSIEIRIFSLANVDPPSEILERYMRGLLLQIEEEKEQFVQDRALELKQSELEKNRFLNTADEILANATAQKDLISITAEAEKDKTIQLSYITTLKEFFKKLNVQREDHKLSLIMIRNLEDAKNLIHPDYSFEKQTLTNP